MYNVVIFLNKNVVTFNSLAPHYIGPLNLKLLLIYYSLRDPCVYFYLATRCIQFSKIETVQTEIAWHTIDIIFITF